VQQRSISREVNDRVRQLAGNLNAWGPDATYHFFCLCDCFEYVEMSVGEYDACDGDVYRDGHSRALEEAAERRPPGSARPVVAG
jgi:hypothetical protein